MSKRRFPKSPPLAKQVLRELIARQRQFGRPKDLSLNFLSERVRRLSAEAEKTFQEAKAALERSDARGRWTLAQATRALGRAAAALETLVTQSEKREPRPGVPSLLSRLVLVNAKRARPPAPSVSAQALAMLLEDPSRSFEATEVAEHLGCSVPIARTILNRLVNSGHADRVELGRFQARRSAA